MSELPWGSEVAEESRPETEAEKAAGEPGTLAMSANEFAALEERVLRAVNLVKRERIARTEAEERAAQAHERATQAEARAAQAEARATQVEERATHAEAREQDRAAELDSLQKEVQALRAERDAVRHRVEKVLSQLDELEA